MDIIVDLVELAQLRRGFCPNRIHVVLGTVS